MLKFNSLWTGLWSRKKHKKHLNASYISRRLVTYVLMSINLYCHFCVSSMLTSDLLPSHIIIFNWWVSMFLLLLSWSIKYVLTFIDNCFCGSGADGWYQYRVWASCRTTGAVYISGLTRIMNSWSLSFWWVIIFMHIYLYVTY